MSSINSSENNPSSQRIDIKACPTTQITVFCDRAEVTREVTFTPTIAGNHCLLVSGLTESAEPDSIRVKYLPASQAGEVKEKEDEKEKDNQSELSEKKGEVNVQKRKSAPKCTILQVSFDINYRPHDDLEVHSEREVKARECLSQAKANIIKLRAQLGRVTQQDQLVHGYLKSMLVSSSTPSGNGNAVVQPPSIGSDLATVSKLLEFHAKQGADIDQRRQTIQQALDKEEKAEAAAAAELQQLRAHISASERPRLSRDVSILLKLPDIPPAAATPSNQEVKEATTPFGSITLSLTYLVRNASWVPSYDCRVSSLEASSMSLTYFGVVRQSSGEDWTDAHLVLSTAAPATGGNPPFPTTLKAKWQSRVSSVYGAQITRNAHMPMQASMALGKKAKVKSRRRRTSIDALEAEMSSDSSDSEDEDNLSIDQAVYTSVKQGGTGSHTFTIDRPCTVTSDNKEHKVTIAMLPLSPQVRHFCVPALEAAAYIQTTTTNTSPYPLLASESVSVFIEGSYLTKSEIKHTSPGQSFVLFLGVDPMLKVEHKTIKDECETGTSGKVFSSKTLSSITREYRTLLHNTKTTSVTVSIVQMMPRSTDKNIEVTLLQPPRTSVPLTGANGKSSSTGQGELKVGETMQNKVTNNIVFLRCLDAKAKMELPFSYAVKWPHDKNTGRVEII